MKTFTIGTNDANQRFDKYLKKLLPNASVSFLYKMLRKKNITLDGKKATGKETLQKGAQVAVFFSDETLHKFMQDTKKLQEEFHMLQRLPMKGLSIIYEDTDILIADKPYNMLSQKAKEQDLSANEYLLGYLIRSGALSLETFGTFRPSVCNRLDRNTTGLLLMGKTLAGAQMQTILANPLASPFTLGISAAASFGAALGLVGMQACVGVDTMGLCNGFGGVQVRCGGWGHA